MLLIFNEIYCVAFKVSFACKAIIIKTFKKRCFAFNWSVKHGDEMMPRCCCDGDAALASAPLQSLHPPTSFQQLRPRVCPQYQPIRCQRCRGSTNQRPEIHEVFWSRVSLICRGSVSRSESYCTPGVCSTLYSVHYCTLYIRVWTREISLQLSPELDGDIAGHHEKIFHVRNYLVNQNCLNVSRQ